MRHVAPYSTVVLSCLASPAGAAQEDQIRIVFCFAALIVAAPLAPEGRLLASTILGGDLLEQTLNSKNHILFESEPAWRRFQEAALAFPGVEERARGDQHVFAALSPREREVLALINEGLGNAAIGERLSISEKTVRNHLSKVFDKLGVWTRAQAIVFARDHGFHP